MITTVSSEAKAVLAGAAGAQSVINYRSEDVVSKVRELAPQGVDLVVEVDSVSNAEIDRKVLAPNATVSIYASDARDLSVPVRPVMTLNARYQFVFVYTIPATAKIAAIEDVAAADRGRGAPGGRGGRSSPPSVPARARSVRRTSPSRRASPVRFSSTCRISPDRAEPASLARMSPRSRTATTSGVASGVRTVDDCRQLANARAGNAQPGHGRKGRRDCPVIGLVAVAGQSRVPRGQGVRDAIHEVAPLSKIPAPLVVSVQ